MRRRPVHPLHRRHDRTCRRAWSGVTRTCSSPRSAVPIPAASRSRPRPTSSNGREPAVSGACPASPFTHGTAHWMALATLFQGGTVGGHRRSRPSTPSTCGTPSPPRRSRCSSSWATHSARPLADALDRAPDRWDLGRLLVVVSGGATLSPAVRQDLLRHLPGTVLVDGYGTSETGGQGLDAGVAGAGRRRAPPLPRRRRHRGPRRRRPPRGTGQRLERPGRPPRPPARSATTAIPSERRARSP